MDQNIRLFCKDSKNMDELKSGEINLVITSPPYFDLKNYNKKNNHQNQIGDSITYADYLNDLNAVWKECIRTLSPDGKICINIMPIFLAGNETKFKRRVTKTVITDIENYMYSTGEMYLHSLYIWDKRKIVRFSSFGSYPYPPNIFSTMPYEWIIVFAKEGKRKINKENKKLSKISVEDWQNWAINSIWEMQPESSKRVGHPAPFPLELPMRLIKLYSFVGDVVLDPFVGSGTTLIAAHKLNRKSVGYDVNPEYINLANKRIQNSKELFDNLSE